jgi:tRNA threonylcarbamoyladenosine biosynthesis protein TsaB
VLALDTSAASCSVALEGPGGRAVRVLPMTQGHSRHVLGQVDAVLSELAVLPSEIDAIGFGAGPGAFTGLRIACGIAQGLGLGWRRPLVAVDALRTLAFQACDPVAPEADAVWVAIDVRMGEVAYARFARPADFLADPWQEPALGPVLARPVEALAALRAAGDLAPVLAGDAFGIHEPLVRWASDSIAHRPEDAVQPLAWSVARIAALGLARGRAMDPANAAPLYLRDKVALDVSEQAMLRALRDTGGRR